MTRLHVGLIAALAIIAAVVGVYLYGQQAGKDARDLDAAREEIEIRERIDDALIPKPDCAHWLERLSGDC